VAGRLAADLPGPGTAKHSGVVRKLLFVLGIALSACGGAEPEPPVVPATRVTAPGPERAPGTLWRDEIVATIDAGLGTFLQRVEVEASLPNGRFEGFRIVALHPREFWRGVDLQQGDVVTRVNGMPIERETDAYDAFQALRSASELRVSILRGGAPRALVYRIVDRPRATESSRGPLTSPAKTVQPRR
jgi:hypothetical protein